MPLSPAPGAPVRQRLRELRNLVRKLHRKDGPRSRRSRPAKLGCAKARCLTPAPVSAAIATSTAISAAATTAAVAAATAAAVAATTITAAAATSAAAGRTRFTGTRFVHGQGPAFDGLPIELRDGLLRVCLTRHRDKREAARFTGELVLHQRDFLHWTYAGKHILQVGFGSVEGKISYV